MKTKWYTPAALEERVEAYFRARADDGDAFPDEPGLILHLAVSQEAYARYGESVKTKDILARARLRRESWLLRRMTTDPKFAQVCLNALKQPENGGYTDRPGADAPKTLVIQLAGVGKDAFG